MKKTINKIIAKTGAPLAPESKIATKINMNIIVKSILSFFVLLNEILVIAGSTEIRRKFKYCPI